MNTNMEGAYPAVAYQQIQNQHAEKKDDSSAQQDEETVFMTHTPENSAIINNSTKWVFCLLIIQILISIPYWGPGAFGTFFPYVNLFMAVVGWIGVRSQNLGLIVAHFLYSMMCLFGLVMLCSMAVFYVGGVDLLWLAGFVCFILALSFFLRKQRLLIQALSATKVPVADDVEDPMLVELSMTPVEAPASAPLACEQQQAACAATNFGAFAYPPAPFYAQDPAQPVPVLVQTEQGTHQVVYMYPVMPNPQQLAPAYEQQQQ